MPVIAYIGLGSNRGDRIGTCRRALELLNRAGSVVKVSSFYCTEPVGYEQQEEFVNAVAKLETGLSPGGLLAACRAIENELGRVRLIRWGPRTIDLDILLYGNDVIETPDLTIPHPQMDVRGFVLVPLNEIAPRTVHPVLNKTVARLLSELKDPHRVVKCGAA
jgi:2-amino-4-hydroxy-6-hydroxymethyldihydropteridine diphosphokinase